MKRLKRAPKMFSRFTSMFHTAVEALAPNLPLQQEFVSHWKAITHYFIETKDKDFEKYHKVCVDQTNLPHHLSEMVQILVQEESQSEGGSTGPCMEYLLHHKVLETLYTLARSDCPPGMKQVVLQFFTKLLSRIRQPLLPHVNVHRPVQKIVRLCGDVTASPAEQEEIQFICVVCAKLKSDPYLVNFFIESPSSPSITSASSPVSAAQSLSPAPQNGSQFTVIESLLNLVESNDARVAVKACEGLILAASLPEEVAIQCLLNHTQFISHLVTKLCTLYSKLPKAMDPTDVECVRAKWGLDFLSEADDQVHFSGKRQLISFLSWLDYCDQLVAIAHPQVAETLVESIKKVFIEGILLPAVLQPSEGGMVTATAHLCQCVHVVSSTLLLNEFVFFLLGPPEPPGEVEGDYKVRDKLIDRCNHLSDELSITTLKLFEVLLHKPNKHIIENLVTRFLEDRTYIDISKLPSNSPTNQDSLFSDVDSDLEQSEQSSSFVRLQQEQNAQPLYDVPSSEECSVAAGDAEEKSRDNDKTELAEEIEAESAIQTETDVSVKTVVDAEVRDDAQANCDDDTEISEEQTKETISEAEDGSCVQAADPGQDPGSVSGMIGEEATPPLSPSSKDLDPDEEITTEQDETIPETEDGSCVPATDPGHDPGSVSGMIGEEATPPLSPSSTDLDPDEEITVHKIVNSFLCLLGEECKSSYQLGETGYETYLRDAHRHFIELSAQCNSFHWPESPTVPSEDDSEPYSEGPFLKVLLDRLSHMLDQSYDVNLHVTSVVSRLALIPHPNLHEILLHPMLPVKDGCRTLPRVLEKIAHDIRVRVKPIPDYHKKLVVIRKQLMGFSESYRSRGTRPDQHGLDNANALTGVIVLEEFCKELAAITFVKYHEAAVQL